MKIRATVRTHHARGHKDVKVVVETHEIKGLLEQKAECHTVGRNWAEVLTMDFDFSETFKPIDER